jgi:acetyltransferase
MRQWDSMLDVMMTRKLIPKKGKREPLGLRDRAHSPTLANETDNSAYPALGSGRFSRATEPDQRPECFPTLALRAYPFQDLYRWNLADRTPAIVRRARIQDESLMRNFQQSLSEETVHLRYFGCVKLETRIKDDLRTRNRHGNYTLVVERLLPIGGEIIGVAYLIKVAQVMRAECAIVISDKWQGRGVGTKLLGALIEIGRTEGLDAIFGYILSENCAMRRICRKLGFELRSNYSNDVLEARIDLRDSGLFRRLR